MGKTLQTATAMPPRALNSDLLLSIDSDKITYHELPELYQRLHPEGSCDEILQDLFTSGGNWLADHDRHLVPALAAATLVSGIDDSSVDRIYDYLLRAENHFIDSLISELRSLGSNINLGLIEQGKNASPPMSREENVYIASTDHLRTHHNLLQSHYVGQEVELDSLRDSLGTYVRFHAMATCWSAISDEDPRKQFGLRKHNIETLLLHSLFLEQVSALESEQESSLGPALLESAANLIKCRLEDEAVQQILGLLQAAGKRTPDDPASGL